MDDQKWELVKDITGYLSTTLLTLLYLPQVYLVYRYRDSRGLTRAYLWIGVLLTLDTIIYGILLHEPPLIIANVIALICVVLLLVAKCCWPEDPFEAMEVVEKGGTQTTYASSMNP
jgi:uncharacterized protein with PQ loop repeat